MTPGPYHVGDGSQFNCPQYLECGQSGRNLNLNIDGARLDALERHGSDPLDHVAPAHGQK
jgi:hypothetical protein